MKSVLIRYNYCFLLLGLLILLVGSSITDTTGSETLYDLAKVATIVFGVWSLSRYTVTYYLGWLIVVIAIVLSVVTNYGEAPFLRYVILGLIFLFFFVAATLMLFDIFTSGKVDLNRLVGAVCVYFMVGFNWGTLYMFVLLQWPDAFSGLSATSFAESGSEMLYYSFVSLTTLGYGDINPVHSLARLLSYTEAIFGQMYLTILVAALVGMHLSSRQQ